MVFIRHKDVVHTPFQARVNPGTFLSYNCIDKSLYFYQFKAFVFYGSQIVGFAGFDGFYGLSPHFQDWNS
jgi:hypothetical protein